MLAIVELIKAPSNDLFKALTLSIYRLISMTFLDDMGLVWGSTFLSNLARLYFLELSEVADFFTVGLVDDSKGFFLKSEVRSLLVTEYLVFVNLFS